MNAQPPLPTAPTAARGAAGSTFGQLWRFGVVGVGVNLVLYAGYLALVESRVGVKVAMSVVYAAGVALGYVLNRRWSFGRRASSPREALAYGVVCLAGYLLNLAALAMLVDALGWPHQGVQAAMVFVVAAVTFVLHKHWVFAPPRAAEGASSRPATARPAPP